MIEPLFDCSYADFPKSEAVTPGMKVLRADREARFAQMAGNVVYDTKDGMDLHLQIFMPRYNDDESKKYPLKHLKIEYNVAEALKNVNQIIDRIYFAMDDMGLSSKEIMSGQYDWKIRELYYEFHFSSVEIPVKENSIQQEEVPSKVKKNTKKSILAGIVQMVISFVILQEGMLPNTI